MQSDNHSPGPVSGKLGIVHCTYLGVSGYNKKYCIFCLKIFSTFTNSVDPDEMLPYGSSLFIIVPI